MIRRTTFFTSLVVVALLTASFSSVALGASAPAAPTDTVQSIPDPDTRPGDNASTTYRGIEPTQEQLDKPVALDTAPEDLSESGDGGAASASSESIVMDPSDDDTDHPAVGTTKFYLGSDLGSYYFKEYTLVAVGDNMEVWVANDLSWPAGDPREDPTITEQQAESMAEQFDENMYPVETDVFGTPDTRTGTDSLLEDLGAVPDDYYVTDTSEGASERSVLLVDNVRDENYYNPDYPLYIAGFYAPTIQQYTDRNTIAVDAYNWQEINETNDRTGYEGTLAHEYQHLIHGDLDGDETSWVNEGMSDYAETITGYGVPQGHLGAYESMPSNSLVNWEDQGAINVLADYGIAYTWTMYLEDQYGQAFITNLAHDDANGIQGVENTLGEAGASRDFYELYQDFSTATATDTIGQANEPRYTFDNLDVQVDTDTDTGTAGAWGTNYRTVDTSETGPITGVTVSGTDFTGTQWTTTTDPVSGSGEVLYSGSGNLLDRHAIVEADLSGTTNPELTFDSYQRIEESWDFGFVQVSTDGGETWESLSNADTTSDTADGAHPTVTENVPGLTGDTDGWETQTFDLSAYQGQEVLISFRYVTDWAFVKDGWYVRNVDVAGQSVPTDSTDAFLSEREATGDHIEYQFTFIGVKHNGNYKTKQLDMRTFDEGDQQEIDQFLHNGNFERVVVASTWAAEQGESGRVPVGVEFEYAHDKEDSDSD